jgi:hypothetical protein
MANPYRYSSDTTGLLDLLADYGTTSNMSDLLSLLAGWDGTATAPSVGGQTPIPLSQLAAQEPPRPSPQQTPFLNAQQQPAAPAQVAQTATQSPEGMGYAQQTQTPPFNPETFVDAAERTDPTGPGGGVYNPGTDAAGETNWTLIGIVAAVAIGGFLLWKYKR